MGANSKIEWTDHTFNGWVGCAHVSPACDHCYAESWAKRSGHPELWNGTRRRTTAENWRQPLLWDKRARQQGVRKRVFCMSLADVFDNEADPQWRADLMKLVGMTTHLDWLFLTKRIGNARRMLNEAMDRLHLPRWDQDPWRNVWIGATVVNQDEADRDVPKLIATPAHRRFLSIEPMLGRVDLCGQLGMWWNQTMDCWEGTFQTINRDQWGRKRIDWIIVGGESGSGARAMHPEWVRSIRSQCGGANVDFFFKQWGQYLPEDQEEARKFSFETADGRPAYHEFPGGLCAVRLRDKHDAGRVLDGRTHEHFPQGE